MLDSVRHVRIRESSSTPPYPPDVLEKSKFSSLALKVLLIVELLLRIDDPVFRPLLTLLG